MKVPQAVLGTMAGTSERRRRNRKAKACCPCRTRKVRCDYEQPCSTCVRRDHTQLCIYSDRASHATQEHLHSAAEVTAGRGTSRSMRPSRSPVSATTQLRGGVDDPSTSSDVPPPDLLAVLDHVAAHAKQSCEMDDVTGQVTFVGRRAHATVFRTLLAYLPEQTLPSSCSVEAVFGLTNRTISHPFASLWNTTARVTMGDILRSLPTAETCLRYFRSYQQIAQPFFPVINDMLAFERNLCAVLERLVAEAEEPSSLSTRLAADMPRTELASYALLFAILASGCQCCLVVEGDHQLALSSRVFVACSFECLRLANLYISPSPETIQALLILGSVTCNDGNPGATMGMLGMTSRQAQGLGMHTKRECDCSSPTCLCLQSVQPLWRALMMLDSGLSVTYDRMPVSFVSESPDRLRSLSCAAHVEFWDCMFNLRCLQIQWQSLGGCETRMSIPENVIKSYLEHSAQLRDIAYRANSTLSCPGSVQAMLEQLVFSIHLEFFEGTLHCQAAVATTHSTESRLRHFHHMTQKFCSVIQVYLKLRRLSPIVKLSWELSRASKSAAILLAAFEVILRESLAGSLLHKLADLLGNNSSFRSWEDDAVPTSCRAGFETLTCLLQLQSNIPVTTPRETN